MKPVICLLLLMISLVCAPALAEATRPAQLENYSTAQTNAPNTPNASEAHHSEKRPWLNKIELKHLPALLILLFLGIKTSQARWGAMAGKHSVSRFIFLLALTLTLGVIFGISGWIPL